jgi:hypothetical protein
MFTSRLQDLGLELPQPPTMPVGVVTAFSWVRLIGDRVIVSGHGLSVPMGHRLARLVECPRR